MGGPSAEVEICMNPFATIPVEDRYAEFHERYPALNLIGNTRMIELRCFKDEFPEITVFAKAEFTTPLNQFMLVLSPTEGLTTIDTMTPIYYRSALPTGYAVVPRRVTEDRVVAVAPSVISREGGAAYDVPLLNVGTFGDKEREVKMKFGGELDGLEAKAYIARGKGVTKVRMHFDDMNKVPKNKRFTLWTYSPDGTYAKLGHVINSGKRDEAAIKSETSLTDFGLFVTAEDADVTIPTSKVYSVFTYTPGP